MFTPQKPVRMNFSERLQVVSLREGPQAEHHHRQGQHAEHAEHGGVAVVGREGSADLEVGDDGQVDQETENPGAHEVPDAHGDEELDGPDLLGRQRPIAVGSRSVPSAG